MALSRDTLDLRDAGTPGHVDSFVLHSTKSSGLYHVPVGTWVFGRYGSRCDHVVMHQTVSRVHCEVRNRGGRLFVKDLNSRHGVFVNGERVDYRELESGDRLRLGGLTLVVELETASPRDLGVSEVLSDRRQDEIGVHDDNTRIPGADGKGGNKQPDRFDQSKLADVSRNTEYRKPAAPPRRVGTGAMSSVRMVIAARIRGEQPMLRRRKFEGSTLEVTRTSKRSLIWHQPERMKVGGVLALSIIGFLLLYRDSEASTEREILIEARAIEQSASQLLETHASANAWTDLAQQSKQRLEPEMKWLGDRANHRGKASLELLRALRDTLPRMCRAASDKKRAHLDRFNQQLDHAATYLEGAQPESYNFDPAYPGPPIEISGPAVGSPYG